MAKNYLAGRTRVDVLFRERVKKAETKGKKNTKEDQPEYKKVVYPVWRTSVHSAPKSVMNFEFPEFTSDKERIKHNSKITAHLTISEAFSKVYGVDIHVNPMIEAQINHAPVELRVGDVLDMCIKNITKDRVEFDCLNLKQMVSSSVNLGRYPNLDRSMLENCIKVKVVVATPEKVVVDPLFPILEEFLNPILANPISQRVMKYPRTVKVKDLKLTKGGFVGQAVIPSISKLIGEDYTIEAFIPGSQIVLNIADDFNNWVGKTVDAFITSYVPKSNAVGQMSLICSVKEYMKFIGECNLVEMFGDWCANSKRWDSISSQTWGGVVTGVIQSSKKCGVFVEIPALSITGFVTTRANKLGDYKPFKTVEVRITDFEEDVYFDDITKQLHHNDPYVITDGVLEKCNIKPVLQFV